MVVARTPQEYRLVGPGYLRSTAASHAMWESALGLVERPLNPVASADYLSPASRALRMISGVQAKPWFRGWSARSMPRGYPSRPRA